MSDIGFAGAALLALGVCDLLPPLFRLQAIVKLVFRLILGPYASIAALSLTMIGVIGLLNETSINLSLAWISRPFRKPKRFTDEDVAVVVAKGYPQKELVMNSTTKGALSACNIDRLYPYIEETMNRLWHGEDPDDVAYEVALKAGYTSDIWEAMKFVACLEKLDREGRMPRPVSPLPGVYKPLYLWTDLTRWGVAGRLVGILTCAIWGSVGGVAAVVLSWIATGALSGMPNEEIAIVILAAAPSWLLLGSIPGAIIGAVRGATRRTALLLLSAALGLVTTVAIVLYYGKPSFLAGYLFYFIAVFAIPLLACGSSDEFAARLGLMPEAEARFVLTRSAR